MMRFPVFLLAVALLAAACTPAPPPPPAAPPPPPMATAAPPVDVPKPEQPSLVVETFDGKTFDLAQQRGRWVVVNFWATWCNPCLKEIPDLDAFDKSRDDVVVIGLAYEEIERADMEAFLQQHPFSYPMSILDVYNPPADFETPRGLPMTYLIAPDGRVAKKFLGPITSDDLAAAITAHGAEAPADAAAGGA